MFNSSTFSHTKQKKLNFKQCSKFKYFVWIEKHPTESGSIAAVTKLCYVRGDFIGKNITAADYYFFYPIDIFLGIYKYWKCLKVTKFNYFSLLLRQWWLAMTKFRMPISSRIR